MSAGPVGGSRILVIRLGALGDFVQSLGPMAAIRRHHADARIALLTTPPFADLARASGLFDEVWPDGRPKGWNLWARLALRRRLRAAKFARVYDLQTSRRSARFWRAMGRPDWSGHVPGCSLPDPDPDRDRKHTIDRQRGQLAAAGIADVPPADLSFATGDLTRLAPSGPYVLMVPGGSAHRPGKRWPAEKFSALARRLWQRGATPVLIGAGAEAELLAEIVTRSPQTRNLAGRTSFQDIAALARGALGAVGNDTGPMHLIAMAGCPSLALFGPESDPALCAPRPGAQGGKVAILKRDSLAGLSVELVEQTLPFALGRAEGAETPRPAA
jgi:ADP-heptose:LPS heptosyltransferase